MPLTTFIFLCLQKAIELEPAIADELKQLFANGNPTPEAWQALHDKYAGQTFEALAPFAAAHLSPTVPPPPVEVIPAGEVTPANVTAQPPVETVVNETSPETSNADLTGHKSPVAPV